MAQTTSDGDGSALVSAPGARGESILFSMTRRAALRRWLARVGLLVAGSLIALLLAELAVRTLLPEYRALRTDRAMWRYDSTLGWITRAHFDGQQSFGGKQRVAVRTNSLGFRDAEPGPAAPGQSRVLVLGDSFAFGYGVTVDERITEALERHSEGRVDAANLGVTGYSTDQELLVLRRFGERYAPDVVVVMYTGNDPRGNARPVGSGHPKPIFEIRGDALELNNVPVPSSNSVRRIKYTLARHSALFNLAREQFGGLTRRVGLNRLLLDERVAGDGGPGVGESDRARRITRRLILQLQQEAQAIGARFLVLVCAPAAELRPTLRANADLVTWCAEAGVACVDTAADFLESFERLPERELHQADRHHWTAEGHDIAARRLLAAMRALGWLPGEPEPARSGASAEEGG